ncbi:MULTISPECIES: hypothetical protein [Candidatus Ichthyocystis]|nr:MULTISPECIES: hypothetical protein [Ichthyocystis]
MNPITVFGGASSDPRGSSDDVVQAAPVVTCGRFKILLVVD